MSVLFSYIYKALCLFLLSLLFIKLQVSQVFQFVSEPDITISVHSVVFPVTVIFGDVN